MNHIRNLISDSDLDIELLKNIKDRKFDQKHLYTTEEGAFLRGQVQMEEHIDLNLEPKTEKSAASDMEYDTAHNRGEINLFKESDF
mgnify:CR=1 FL=1